MVRYIFSLLLIIFMNNRLVAQHLYAVKKTAADSSGSKSPSFVKKRPGLNNSGPGSSTDNHKTESHQKPANPEETENVSKALETVKVDYNNMPADVQLKINNNKAHGKYLLEGIAKVFVVEIKTCLTDADRKKILLFLKPKKGFINSQFVSAGLVKIIVEPTFDSADMKDAMAGEGIHFNFLNRLYLLKN